jgi:type I restriction enzyme R subunit
MLASEGDKAVDRLPEGIRKDRKAVAETIENNIRRLIVDELAINPKYYERMSELLDALVKTRRLAAIEYKQYLADLAALAKKLKTPEAALYPASVTTPAQRALYDNLDKDAELALRVDEAIRTTKKAGWHGSRIKEREVRLAIKKVLTDDELVDAIFDIAKRQRDY